MTAHVIFGVKKVLDQAVLVEYRKLAHKTIEEAGGRIIVGFNGFVPLKGDDFLAVVVVQFDTREAAEAWYHSPGYVAASKLRDQGSECVVSLVHW